MNNFPYPKSFPNNEELTFLKLVLSSDSEFPKLFEEWKSSIIFENIDYATSRLLPLVYLRMKKLNYSFDDSVNGRIKGVYRLAWVKNQQLLGNLGVVCNLFKQHNISVLLLKGVSFLLDVYEDAGARFVGDADIIIPPANAKQAVELMLQHGWHLHMPRPIDITKFSATSLPHVVKEFTFSNEHGYEIDIHWRLFELSGNEKEEELLFSFDALWKNKRTTTFKEQQFNVISPEDMLLHVIIHGAEGNVQRTLRWVSDSVAIINKFPLDWNIILQNAKHYHYETELFFAVTFLLEHNFISLPAEVQKSISSIALNKNDLKKYYQNSNSPFKAFGGFPRHWRTYWRYEARGNFFINFINFFDYLANAWGLQNKQEFFSFVWNKYKDRIYYLFGIQKK